MWPGYIKRYTVGGFINDLREKNNMTQEELSKKSGIERSYISYLEKNKVLPPILKLEKIMDSFKYLNEYKKRESMTDLQKIIVSSILKKYFKKTERVYVITSGHKHQWHSFSKENL